MNLFTDAQVAELRAELGSAVDLDDAWERYQRYQDGGSTDPLRDVIVEVLRERLATMVAQPASFNIEGDYSQDTGKNITALQKQLDGLTGSGEDLDDSLPVVGLGQLRSRWSRRRCR